MSDLEFVAFSDDGKMIILQSADGNWIEVPIKDSPTSYAVPEERPADTDLSPREIQSRIRAGISPAELAATTNSSLERIMSFAPPILLERSHVAAKATKTVIRRASGSGTLGDIVELKLESLGVDLGEIEWDSYRREDGRWTVLLNYPADGSVRTAAWLFDVRNNALVAADEDARWLTGDQNRPTFEVAVDSQVTEVVEFLAPVTPLVSHRGTETTRPTPEIVSESENLEELETLMEFAEESTPTEPEPVPDLTAANDFAIAELLEPTSAPTATQATEMAQPEPTEFQTTELFESESTESVMENSNSVESDSDADETPTENNPEDVRPPRIPSWDEILFGPANPEN